MTMSTSSARHAPEPRRSVCGTGELLLGIDAGGTSIRARAAVAGTTVYDGTGGPGNPLAVDVHELSHNYGAALDGCPDPGLVAACVAGAFAAEGRTRVEQVLHARFPGATVRVEPDYVAAYMVAQADIVTIAGTGSIVCSRPQADRVFCRRAWLARR
jgi:N-acetylglucosamine kinase-like BadF-type ATPase